jgi:hypothetical protein
MFQGFWLDGFGASKALLEFLYKKSFIENSYVANSITKERYKSCKA